MESPSRFPLSSGSPLHPISPERANQRPLSTFELESPLSQHGGRGRHERDSSVQEKIAAFNSVAFQGKQLERKANDAALKRAMVGREEAESEMRRYRDETRALRRHIEEGKDRERKVGERLETVLENYGRAKETHAHTQALWEKEIRRARKENFKSQSVVVKLQEELKSARSAAKSADSDLEQERARSAKREQEAFAARYQLVGVQEELAILQEQIKLVEQERDALRTIAQNEEIARIAAEGRIPLPALPEDDEFATPKKSPKALQHITIMSSAASEEELEDMKMQLTWERRRADRAQDRIEFLELECRSNCCSARASQLDEQPEPAANISAIRVRQSTVYVPSEGVFRTVSPPPESPRVPSAQQMPPPQSLPVASPESPARESMAREPGHYARTPSCEPPAQAVAPDVNTSLLSLLDPRSRGTTPLDANFPSTFSVPTITIPVNPSPPAPVSREQTPEQPQPEIQPQSAPAASSQQPRSSTSSTAKTSSHSYHNVSRSTTIPLADEASSSSSSATHSHPPRSASRAGTSSHTRTPSSSNSITPTISREQALAQIRERRGRARSLANGTTPKKVAPAASTADAGSRRDISAPVGAGMKAGAVRGRSGVRS